MCKSANEPGGPYRCSGDMKAALDRAEQNYDTALTAYTNASGADSSDEVRSNYTDAARALNKAQADYDSTRRGFAVLQHDLAEAEHTHQEQPTAANADRLNRLNTRHATALNRMNDEEQQRARNNNSSKPTPFIPTPATSEHDPADADTIAALAREDGLMTTAAYTPPFRDAPARTTITLYTDDSGSGTRLTYRGRAPSQAAALTLTAAAAADAHRYETLGEDTRSTSVRQDQTLHRLRSPGSSGRQLTRDEDADAKQWIRQGRSAQRTLTTALGPERARQYMDAVAGDDYYYWRHHDDTKGHHPDTYTPANPPGTVLSAGASYGRPTVTVEPHKYEYTDSGGKDAAIMAETYTKDDDYGHNTVHVHGRKLRKDGTLGRQQVSHSSHLDRCPPDVRKALLECTQD